MRNIIIRTLTGILFVALIIASIFYNIPPLYLLFGTFSILCAFEYYKITKSEQDKFGLKIIKLLFIPIYCMLPFFLLYQSAFLEPGNHSYKYEIILGFFLILWANDTGAYLIGSLFGKHKLIERISPKKTWEGLIGGLAIAMICAWILSNYFQIFNLQQWIMTAMVISVFGIIGDLFESYLKRIAKVKDSGNLLPGHGGFLDRFDAMLFAAPAYYIFLKAIIY